MQIDLNTKTLTELEAMAYNLICHIQSANNDLKTIECLIIEKRKEQEKTKETE